MIHLYVTLRGHPVGRFDIEGGRVGVGRHAENEVHIDSQAISRHHCVLERDPTGAWTVRDLGSHNGTLLNGTRVDEPARVKHGDTLGVGQFLISVHTDAARGAEGERLRLGPSQPAPSPAIAEHAATRKGFLILHNRAGAPVLLERDVLQLGAHREADVAVPGPRKLALIVRGHGGFQVVNVGPVGDEVRVNGQAVEDRQWLRDGDEMQVGPVLFRFHEGQPLRDESTLSFDAPSALPPPPRRA